MNNNIETCMWIGAAIGAVISAYKMFPIPPQTLQLKDLNKDGYQDAIITTSHFLNKKPTKTIYMGQKDGSMIELSAYLKKNTNVSRKSIEDAIPK